MRIGDKFLQSIYSSKPLDENDFSEMVKPGSKRIFKHNFYEHKFRKNIISKFKKSIVSSEGGVFLVSGYRGVGKTTFLNYIRYKLSQETETKYISDSFNFSSIVPDLMDTRIKHEILYQIAFIFYKNKQQFDRKIRNTIDDLIEYLLYEKTLSQSSSVTTSVKLDPGTFSGKLTSKLDKKSIFSYSYAEYLLHSILTRIKKNNQKIIIILDELDKVPILQSRNFKTKKNKDKKIDGNNEDNSNEGNDHKNNNNEEKMDWLLQILSDIKYLLFESGIIFIVVVNKDVFDYWKYSHSQDDLFSHLVTNMLYIPGYFKEEMELNDQFKITLNEDVIPPYPYSPQTIKNHFQQCAYYESYGNPRLYFQQLSRTIKNDEIRLNAHEIRYLKTRINLFTLIDLLNKYVFEGDEHGFRQMLFAINILINVFREIEKKGSEKSSVCNNKESIFTELFEKYKATFKGNLRVNLEDIWQTQPSKEKNVSYLFIKFETLFTMLREQDAIDNYPATNYITRRIIDFIRIVEESHLLAIDEIIKRMNFQEYEIKDSMAQYLIGLMIPLCIVILVNKGIFVVRKELLIYDFRFDLNIDYLHLAFEHELNGEFDGALKNYNYYISNEPNNLDALFRKISSLYYMIRLGYNENIEAYINDWNNCLKQIEETLKWSDRTLGYKLAKAKYDHCRYFYEKIMQGRNDFKGNLKENIKAFDTAISKNPLDAEILLWKGYLLYWRGYYFEAAGLFEQSAKYYMDPKALIRLLDSYINMENFDEAFKTARICVEVTDDWAKKALLITALNRIPKDKYKNNQYKEYIDMISGFIKSFTNENDASILKSHHFSLVKKDIKNLAGILGMKKVLSYLMNQQFPESDKSKRIREIEKGIGE